MPQTPELTKFLISVDDESRELYILHREFPACLIWIKQETPVRFIILDIYDDIDDENSILTMPFVEEAKTFWNDYATRNLDNN